jgi:hypothetical protein
LPPSTILQAMLRKITERFARELAEPAPLAPEWSEFEWIVARAVAAMHGVSPLLSRTLCWQGPVGWAEFLEEQRTHTTCASLTFCSAWIAERVRPGSPRLH